MEDTLETAAETTRRTRNRETKGVRQAHADQRPVIIALLHEGVTASELAYKLGIGCSAARSRVERLRDADPDLPRLRRECTGAKAAQQAPRGDPAYIEMVREREAAERAAREALLKERLCLMCKTVKIRSRFPGICDMCKKTDLWKGSSSPTCSVSYSRG